MDSVRQLLIVLLASCLSVTTSLNDSRESCPSAAIVDLTRETPDSSGSVNKSGDVFLPRYVWTENNKTFCCSCGLKTCLPICSGAEFLANDTEFSIYISDRDDQENREGIRLFFSDPDCSADSFISTESMADYEILRDGSLREKNLNVTQDSAQYCLSFNNNMSRWSVVVCKEIVIPAPRVVGWSAVWLITCSVISTIFAIATFIVYTIVPELKNLQGSIFRCYLVTFIISKILYLVLSVARPFEYDDYVTIAIVIASGYMGLSSTLWLHVMSYDIWQKFRNLHVNTDTVTEKRREKRKFIQYSIYVWVSPVVYVSAAVCRKVFRPSKFGTDHVMVFFLLFPLAFVIVCNAILYISTALKIRRIKKETANLVGGFNKHHKESEQWFNLYARLFILMEGPLILWLFVIYMENKLFYGFIYAVGMIQGISIFIMFVWKYKVKQSLRDRLSERSLKLLAFRRSDPAPPGPVRNEIGIR